MNRAFMKNGCRRTLVYRKAGQSMVEFALILPLLVLFILGIFELGRAFFAFIAISNAAREGARVITFWPGKTTGNDVVVAINTEVGNSPMVSTGNIASRTIQCATGG
ncbi:MAG TPA: TadE family protein, partial [Anaerolineales bacterium]|nr:TadE family protein [Anaerolineales bacterium]